MVRPIDLRVEYDRVARSIGTARPRFSWRLDSDRQGVQQVSWRVRTASASDLLTTQDLWDSGEQIGNSQNQVTYDGADLQSNTEYWWAVEIVDETGELCTSDPVRFATTLLSADDWTAEWIGAGPLSEPRVDMHTFTSEENQETLKNVEPDMRAPMFRTEFTIEKPVHRVRAFLCGLGYHELHVNGMRAGDWMLTPSKTDYREQVLFDTFDVTGHVRTGQNAIGVMIGSGWFNPQREWWSWRMQWFGSPRMICQVHVDYEDGTEEIIGSDDSWRTARGPVVSSCIYSGEVYDARLEQDGWTDPGFDDNGWSTVNIVQAPCDALLPAYEEPVRVRDRFAPVSMSQPQPGVYVYDLGQNISGWVKIRVKGPRGTAITLRFTEKTDENGMVDVSNLSLARPQDQYTLSGDGEEVYEPRFTWHGFQFVELTGYPGEPSLDALEAVFAHTDCSLIGDLATGSDIVQKIHHTTVMSQRCNVQGLPLDCPQRDERLGWLGDGHVCADQALCNLDMARLYTKWLRDMKVQQTDAGLISYIAPRPSIEEDLPWSSAWFVISWLMYVHYGDTEVLAEHYDGLVRYLDYLATQADGHIQKTCHWGDHLCVDERWEHGSGKPVSISTAFYALDVQLMAKIAGVLARSDDAVRYRTLADEIAVAYHERYFTGEQGYDDGAQTANSVALAFGLVPDEHRGTVLNAILADIDKHEGHLTTGLIGTKYLVRALDEAGRQDVIWSLVNIDGFPSWKDMLGDDMTTMVEHWERGDGSYNHPVLGSIDEWFYRRLSGIEIDEARPAYEHVIIRPWVPDDLDHAGAFINTIRGCVASRWEKVGGNVKLEVEIPAGSTATVHLPDDAIHEIGSGTRVFQCVVPR
jgi:alpha-L-rhamnosidase